MLAVGVIAAAVFLMSVLKWWAEGIFETSDALLLAVVFCGLIFGLFSATSVLGFLMAFIPLAAGGTYAIYAYKMGGMQAYLKGECEVYTQAIQSDPRNLAARERLAETLYAMGELDRAISEMQAAVDLGAGVECQYRLSQWQCEQKVRDSVNPVCKWCGAESAIGTRTCPRCGCDLPRRSSFARWLKGGRSANARLCLLVVFGLACIGISLAVLPIQFAFIPLVLFGAALAGWDLIGSSS